MTGWDDILKPAPVPCDGCGKLMEHGTPTHGEHLKTPVGRCYRKTHIKPECIALSRYAVNGEPVKVRETGQDKINAHLRGLR